MTERFTILCEDRTYEQDLMCSEDGLRLKLLVAKLGFEPLLQVIANIGGDSDLKDNIQRLSEDAKFQGQLLYGLSEFIDKISFEHIQELKKLILPITYLKKDDGTTIQLSALPKHFATITDNPRLLSLLVQSCKVQLVPLLRAQSISHILGLVRN